MKTFLIILTFFLSKVLFGGIGVSDFSSHNKTLKDLRDESKEDILVIFSAKWNNADGVLRGYLAQTATLKILDKAKLKIVYADCTNVKSLAFKEMKQYGEAALPLRGVLLHSQGMTTLGQLELDTITTFHNSIKKFILISRAGEKKKK